MYGFQLLKWLPDSYSVDTSDHRLTIYAQGHRKPALRGAGLVAHSQISLEPPAQAEHEIPENGALITGRVPF